MMKEAYLYIMEEPLDAEECGQNTLFVAALLDRFNCNPNATDPLFRVCLPRRHFIAGHTLFENHHNAVDRCKKILCIISPENGNWIRYCQESSFYTYVVNNKANDFLPVFVGFESQRKAREACPQELLNRAGVIFSHPWDRDDFSWIRLAEALGLPQEPTPVDPTQCTELQGPVIIEDVGDRLLSIGGLPGSGDLSYDGDTDIKTSMTQFGRLSSQVTVDDGIGHAEGLNFTDSNENAIPLEGNDVSNSMTQFRRLSSQVTVDDGTTPGESLNLTDFNKNAIPQEDNFPNESNVQKENNDAATKWIGNQRVCVCSFDSCYGSRAEVTSSPEHCRKSDSLDHTITNCKESVNSIMSKIKRFARAVWDILQYF